MDYMDDYDLFIDRALKIITFNKYYNLKCESSSMVYLGQ